MLFFIGPYAYAGSGQSHQSLAADFMYDVGLGRYNEGSYKEAIRWFEKVLLIASEHKMAREYLGRTRAKLERVWEETRTEEIERAIEEAKTKLAEERRLWVGAEELFEEEAIEGKPVEKELILPPIKVVVPEKKLPPSEEVTVLPPGEAEVFPPEEAQAPPEVEKREIIIEPVRAGFERYYWEGEGFKVTDWLGLAARMEIYEEPNPLDDYILEAKELGRTTKSQRAEMIMPLFTRAFAGRVVLAYKNWPRLDYTFDTREILHEFEIKYGIKDQDWQTHEFALHYTFPRIEPIGILTLNPVYKRISLSSKDDVNTAQDRDEYILNIGWIPIPDLEIFGQVDYYEAKKLNTTWVDKPEQRLYRFELRKNFPQYKLKIVPGYSYSKTEYLPEPDTFTKQEIYLDIGKDFTDRLRGASKLEVILSESDWPGGSSLDPNLLSADAEVFNLENKLSYELFKDFDTSVELNYSHGFDFSAFDNIGLLGEVEFFRPGFLRTSLGCEYINYYNLDEDLWLLYFKAHLFM